MLKKFITVLLVVCSVSAKSDFIGSARKRPELFELTDNEVAEFRLTLPQAEFDELKEQCKYGMGNPPSEDDIKSQEGQEGGFPQKRGFPQEGQEGEFPQEGQEGGFPPEGQEGEEDFVFDFSSFMSTFKTKNGTLTVKLNGKENVFKKLTFSRGGSSSRDFGKQGYNFKIRGGKNLYGRTQFRLRPDAREATFLRSKLMCDMHNRMGLTSISANYATFYINDEYLGFYVLMDSIKPSWIESEFGDKDTTSLIDCGSMNNDLTLKASSKGCKNANEDYTDKTEWLEFLKRLDAAQSPEDIDDILDIDLFLKEMAFEYLSGSWDHYLNFGHNFFMYKPKDDKWKYLTVDFDAELGQDIVLGIRGMDFNGNTKIENTDYPTYTLSEMMRPRHLVDILILNNSTRFDNIVRDMVTDFFNPATLYPHIDQLKEFIRPYVELDKIPDENGRYPGRLHYEKDDFTLEQWDANCEFTRVRSFQNGSGYGLKYWILARYRVICERLNMDCDEKYMDENFEYPINENVHVLEDDAFFKSFEERLEEEGRAEGETEVTQPTETQVEVQPTETQIEAQPTETQVEVQPTETQVEAQPTNKAYNCMAELVNLSCCSPKNKIVYFHDDYGDWGYDFKKREWCGITPYEEKVNDQECWSEVYGYSCCKDCAVYETDFKGQQWGYDFIKRQWCGIQSFCSKQ